NDGMQADQLMFIRHNDCRMTHRDPSACKAGMLEKGIFEESFNTLNHAGFSLEDEFRGFVSVEDSVKESVAVVRNHPLRPSYVNVHGLVIDPETGKVDLVAKE